MADKFILDANKKPQPATLEEWAEWFESAERHVAQDEVDGVSISTVFLGLDHQFGGGPPLLFETMIFGGKHNDYQERCSTWEQAVAQHAEALRLVKQTASN